MTVCQVGAAFLLGVGKQQSRSETLGRIFRTKVPKECAADRTQPSRHGGQRAANRLRSWCGVLVGLYRECGAVSTITRFVALALCLCIVPATVEAHVVNAPNAYLTAVQRGDIMIAENAATIELTAERRAELYRINRWINSAIVYRPERVDSWVLTGYEGDCEDYVIAKIDALVERGWPRGALRITYVTTEDGEGHAVLAVTARSEIVILDNRFSSLASTFSLIRAGYTFHAWELPGNAYVWEEVGSSLLFIATLAKEQSCVASTSWDSSSTFTSVQEC